MDIWYHDTTEEGQDHQANLRNAYSVLAQCGFQFEQQKKTGDIPAGLSDLMDELVMVKQNLDQLKEREEQIKQIVMERMQADGLDKYGNDIIQFSRKAAYERESIDTTALKKKMPEVFAEFRKVVKCKESITYKVL